jgi:hypothetical protein
MHPTLPALLGTLFLLRLTGATPISFSIPLVARDSLTESQMIDIAPTSANCDNPPAAGECATAKTAAKFTAQSFDTYGVTSKAEQAAIISLMAFESDDFKYNKNHFPGVAGQGSKYCIFFFLQFLLVSGSSSSSAKEELSPFWYMILINCL